MAEHERRPSPEKTTDIAESGHEIIGSMDLTAFSEKYELSPFHMLKVREFAEKASKDKLHSAQLHSLSDLIPPAYATTPEVRAVVEENIARTLTSGSGDSIGQPHLYVKLFGIQPDFFADSRFDSYRKKGWGEKVQEGRKINFETGELESDFIWSNGDTTEDDTIDALLDGRFTETKKLFSSEELTQRALRGVVAKLNSNKEDDVIVVESYKKEFEITEEQVKDAAMTEIKKNILMQYTVIEDRYPEVKEFYRSPEGLSLAKHVIEKELVSGADISPYLERFGLTKETFNTENIAKSAKQAVSFPKENWRSSQEFYRSLKNRANVFGDEFYEKGREVILAAPKEMRDPFFDETFMHVGDYWREDNEVFKKISVPQDVLDDYLYTRITELGKHNDFYKNTLERDKDKYDVFGLSSEAKNEALSGVYFRSLVFGGAKIGEDTEANLKERIGLDQFVITPRVLSTIKEEYISSVQKGDIYALRTIAAVLDREGQTLSWTAEEKAKIKEASLSGVAQVCDRGSEKIRDFLHKYYPETHTVFFTEDEKTKKVVSEKLVELIERSFWDRYVRLTAKSLEEAISYFSLDREDLYAQIEDSLGKRFIEKDMADQLRRVVPDFDFDAHNKRWAEKYAPAQFAEILAKKRFADVQKFSHLEQVKELLEQEVQKQEKILENPNASESMRSYATEFVMHFFWQTSFVEGITEENKAIIRDSKLDQQSGFIERIAQTDFGSRPEYFKEYQAFFKGQVGAVAANRQVEGLTADEYKLVCMEVYPQRNYDTYQHLADYEDRTKDLKSYTFDKEGYPLKLSGVLGYKVKEGEVEDPQLLADFSRRISDIKGIATPDALNAFLEGNIGESQAKTVEGKILEYFKQKGYSVDTMNVLLAYQLLGSYDDFIAGSADRVSMEEDPVSKNYILLDELVNRYGDTMKETIKALQKNVAEGEDRDLFARSPMTKFHARYSEIAESVIADLQRIPREKIKDETIQKKIARTLKNSFQGVSSVQERAEYFATLFTTSDLDDFSAAWERHFDELFAVEDEYMIDTAKVEGLQSNVFQKLQSEISKYEELKEVDETRGEEKMKKDRAIRGYFSKNKENAHARMVGDICIAADPNMLKNEKYFEFVLFDEDREKCVGTTMLLEMNEPEKKYLLYCPNPSVGLVSEVSAKKLYKMITDKIIAFSADNGFDGVVVDKTHGKSTNRAGLFQQSLDQSCLKDETGKEMNIDLENPYTLGAGYQYQKNLQFIWKK